MAHDPKPEAKAGPEAGEPTPGELAKLRIIEATGIYASTFRLQGSGNDFNLILQRGHPALAEDGTIHESHGKLETVAVVTMSPQSLKDLYLLLEGQVKSHEQEFGVMETPFTKRRAELKP